MTGSTLSGNTTSEDGGGIVNFATGDGATATATVTDSTLSTNRAADDGGGIASRATAGAAVATLTVTGSTLNGNFADDDGGAIAILIDDSGSGVAGPPTDSTLVRNSTLSGNNSDDESGAIDLLDATATLDYVTVSENSAASGSHVARSFGDSTLTYGRSVFTLSASVPVFFFEEGAGGTFVSAGDNISQHDLPGVTGTDVVNTDPLLGPLAANGGPTATHLLLPGSAAINHIPLARCGAVATDQRGFSRPLPAGGACDSGAVEMTAPTTLIAASATSVYGGTATLSATLTATVGGAPVNGRTIAFTLNGTAVGTATTNGSGVATLPGASLGTIPIGSYPAGVGASFAGDSTFSPSHSTAGLTVTKATTATNAPDATAPYGAPAANPNATVTNTSPGSTATVNEGTVTFVVKQGAQTICTLTLPVVGGTASGNCPQGPLPVGTYAITASYSGGPNFLPSSDTATLTVARRVIWVKATDRTVGLRQPNPPTTPPVGCATQPVGSGACWIELANGSTLAPGDDWPKLNLANLRFQYARNPPSTNSVEKVGSTYRITAFGLSSANYDVRYLPGTLTVVP
ncbi:MAG: Ig-like domain-containing protein [Thermomicrobiales bacterium]